MTARCFGAFAQPADSGNQDKPLVLRSRVLIAHGDIRGASLNVARGLAGQSGDDASAHSLIWQVTANGGSKTETLKASRIIQTTSTDADAVSLVTSPSNNGGNHPVAIKVIDIVSNDLTVVVVQSLPDDSQLIQFIGSLLTFLDSSEVSELYIASTAHFSLPIQKQQQQQQQSQPDIDASLGECTLLPLIGTPSGSLGIRPFPAASATIKFDSFLATLLTALQANRSLSFQHASAILYPARSVDRTRHYSSEIASEIAQEDAQIAGALLNGLSRLLLQHQQSNQKAGFDLMKLTNATAVFYSYTLPNATPLAAAAAASAKTPQKPHAVTSESEHHNTLYF
ncbi:hypothetical protein GQ42DRAFT_165403 [Ramicandelaber brevisporus]|nr:hypothetical protein GQ42DRAFT_165403 [Ramicandelaber brevisporus]